MPRQLAAAAAVIAAIALTACVPMPPAVPQPIDVTPATPSTSAPQPTATAAPSATSAPTTGGADIVVDGSTATLSADGIVWRLELQSFGPAPLDELTEFAGDEGAPAPAPPAGLEVGWACFRATLEAAPDGYSTLVDVAKEFSVPGGEDGWDYEVIELSRDLYAASGEVGDVIDPTCPVVLVPEGFAYDAITIMVRDDAGTEMEASVPAP